MAPLEEELVVHRDLPDLGPQPLDLLVAVIRRPTLEGPSGRPPGTAPASGPTSPPSPPARAPGCRAARRVGSGESSPCFAGPRTVPARSTHRGQLPHAQESSYYACVSA